MDMYKTVGLGKNLCTDYTAFDSGNGSFITDNYM